MGMGVLEKNHWSFLSPFNKNMLQYKHLLGLKQRQSDSWKEILIPNKVPLSGFNVHPAANQISAFT